MKKIENTYAEHTSLHFKITFHFRYEVVQKMSAKRHSPILLQKIHQQLNSCHFVLVLKIKRANEVQNYRY